MLKLERTVSTAFGILAMCLTSGIVLIAGLALSIEYESNCTTSEATGRTLCSTKSAWKGWTGIPIQSLAGAAGTAGGAYAAYRFGRKQQPDSNGNGGDKQ